MAKTIEHTLTIKRVTMPSGDVIAEAVCTCGDHFGNAVVRHAYPCNASCRAQMSHPVAGATDTELLAMIDGGLHADLNRSGF
jgi:hypothetical protein